jgi:hypothetical protein
MTERGACRTSVWETLPRSAEASRPPAAGSHHDKRGVDLVPDLNQLPRGEAQLDPLVSVRPGRQRGVGAAEDLAAAPPAAVTGPLPLRL